MNTAHPTTPYRRSRCAGCGRRARLDRGRICRACRHTDRKYHTHTSEPYMDALRRLFGERVDTMPDSASMAVTPTRRPPGAHQPRGNDGMDTRLYRKSKWLKSTDLDGPTPATIESVSAERMRNSGEDELVVKFAEFEKLLVLNGTNHDSLMEVTGSFDSGDWIGRRVELYTVPEPMAKTGHAVRIRAASQPAAQPGQTAQASGNLPEASQPAATGTDDGQPFNDQIPF